MLGKLLEKGASLSAVYVNPPLADKTLDLLEGRWLSILEHATSFNNSSATDCIWTCGLTDAGLHNTFLSKIRGLELFDLGEPGVMPTPAFLTKFLMSFFHTAGMQEDKTGSWVRRFDIVDGRLVLTQETEDLIPYLERTFTVVLDSLVKELFEGDESVRKLLVKYVVLQVLSDAAFCLGRWEQKGGGVPRKSESSQHLAKWLWRSLWDFYIASHVYTAFLQD
jgi:hypothetical protein